MKLISLMAASVLLAMSLAGEPASAQTGCGDVDFASSITSRFPNIKDACLGVVTREGRMFAHFQTEIVRVSGNTVRAKVKLPDGTYSETMAFPMDPNARVNIEGRSYRYRDLGRGQELDIYLPSDQWEFYIPETEDFVASRTVATVTPTVVEEEEPATLPATASPLPLLGLFGCALTLLGLGLWEVRRRLS